MKESVKESSAPYKTLDAWRGLASLWVTWFHVCHLMLEGHVVAGSALVLAASATGYLGVQLFFVISGYCIALAACSVLRRQGLCREFVVARLRRIYPPCWISLIFYAVTTLAATALVRTGRLAHSASAQTDLLHQPLRYYIGNLTLTQIPLGVSFLSLVCWTLCYEVAFYLIVAAALFFALRGRNTRFLLDSLHGLTALTLVFLIIAPHSVSYPFDLWPHFGLGVMVCDLVKHPQAKAPKWWFGAAAIGMAAFILLHDIPIGVSTVGYHSSRVTFLAALLFAWALLLLYRYDEKISRNPAVKVFAVVGVFSYSLYLIHFLCIGLFNQAVNKLQIHGAALYAMLIMTTLASVVAARIFHQFFERPFMKSPMRSPQTETLVTPAEPEKVS